MAAKYEKVRIYEILCEIRKMFSYIRKKFVFRSRGGFTLIETMVALAVILAAVVGPAALVSRGLFNFSFSKNKIIAANLAQEGIELVRLVRDNNIMCDKLDDGTLDGSWEWNRDPDGGVFQNPISALHIADMVPLKNAPAECGEIRSPQIRPSTNDPLRLDLDQQSERFGIYNYSTGSETIFIRRVEIDVSPSENDPDIQKEDQMDIISTVEWIERGVHNPACPVFESRCLALEERLYNWK